MKALVRFGRIARRGLCRVQTWFLVLVYVVLTVYSVGLAYLIGFDLDVELRHIGYGLSTLPWFVAVKLLLLLLFGQFRGVISYFRLPDLLRIVWACAVTSFIFLLIRLVEDYEISFPRRVIFGEFIVSVSLLSMFRLGMRKLREYRSGERRPGSRVRRVGIIGAGDAGERFAADLMARRSFGMRPVVFLDDDPGKHGRAIHGLDVVPIGDSFNAVREEFRLDELVVAIANPSATRLSHWVEMAREAGLALERIPTLSDIASGRTSLSKVRPVELEDLLGRETVALDSEGIAALIQAKSVMVTGAGGSIGGEICRQVLENAPRQLLAVDFTEIGLYHLEQDLADGAGGSLLKTVIADVKDRERMQAVLEHFRPEIIFHAAAHKHVPIMESQPGEALKTNTLGTIQLAECAMAAGVERFVLISTDKAINPTSAMGASKRLAEIGLQMLQQRPGARTRFMAVRFGNVLGSSGSVIPLFKRQIAEKGYVTVTHPDVTRYFMTVPEAVGLVLQSAALGSGGDIFILDMGRPIKIIDVARHLIRLSGLLPDTDVEIRITGLRPGEKLFEELTYDGENIAQTTHPQVMRLKGEPPPDQLAELLSDLRAVADHPDSNEIKNHFHRWIPEYQPFID